MAFSTKNARSDPFSADVIDWCRSIKGSDRATIIITLLPGTQTDEFLSDLEDLEIVSNGPGVIVAKISRTSVDALRSAQGVARVEMPQTMFPKQP